jgi:hypothetical protein
MSEGSEENNLLVITFFSIYNGQPYKTFLLILTQNKLVCLFLETF